MAVIDEGFTFRGYNMAVIDEGFTFRGCSSTLQFNGNGSMITIHGQCLTNIADWLESALNEIRDKIEEIG